MDQDLDVGCTAADVAARVPELDRDALARIGRGIDECGEHLDGGRWHDAFKAATRTQIEAVAAFYEADALTPEPDPLLLHIRQLVGISSELCMRDAVMKKAMEDLPCVGGEH